MGLGEAAGNPGGKPPEKDQVSTFAMPKKFVVTAQWDDEAGVWVATSDDIPGLVTEAANLDDLIKRVVAVAPELVEDNAHLIALDDYHPGDLVDLCVLHQFRLDGEHAH